MKMTTTQRRIIHVMWLCIVPTAFYVAYQFYPANEIDYSNLLMLAFVLLAIMNLPIAWQHVSMTLERWVVFTVFFQYGIIAEMVFMQVGMIMLIFTLKSSTPKLLRFTFNSINFAVTSLLSSLVYYAVGGSLEYMSFSTFMIAGFIYASVYSWFNSLLLTAFFRIFKQETGKMGKIIIWDYVTSILLLPFAIISCYLFQQFGNKSMLLVGIPFILVLLVTRSYLRSNQQNEVLSSAAMIGHELAEQLRVDEVLQSFLGKIKTVIPYESAYIIDRRIGEQLVLLTSTECVDYVEGPQKVLVPPKKTEQDGLSSGRTKKYSTRKDLQTLRGFTFPIAVESAMTAPIVRYGKTEAYLLVTSTREYAFNDVPTKIVDLLTGYLAVAVEKARYYERTVEKSVKCGLTGLYNFRYLDEKMDEELVRYHTGEIGTLSTIILDIDRFKGINDSYGHQSGNDLLVAFATILQNYTRDGVTLARYGGEEFVFILPDWSKEAAIALAETIRKEVEETTFTILPDLSPDREPTIVQMTCSIGVASLPEDAADGKDLLRNADRALYIGGKQAGRNKVGVYEENPKINAAT
ncbi:GGDEF domain-containing protein [Sporosarcina saromensis]|uniref:GGDEF domain-containing protein n=1 Tax=Sporosarcina saromensis TaxID=359365 RepID=A0ABU4G5Z8_9BACL|nr:GGDEF domain-containing protein [Sporosarcina saromensis]MDW0112393.1 GGDEF domain-containing protein [Sporosarcina saromensis]